MSEQPSRHVVILEDDENFRRSIARALDDKGLRVTAPEDYKGAIETIEQADPVDLMIADIGLWPGAPHGIALGNMAQLRHNGLKVIYMSGIHDVKWAAAYGDAAAVLQKPFTAEKLVEAVMAVLEIPVDGGA
jgi:DNA-binding NtrC family response regulator